METLEQCPCGVYPTDLDIFDGGQGGKWAYVAGTCCNEWHIEFRTDYHKLDSEECKELAIKAWNDNWPNAKPSRQTIEGRRWKKTTV